MAVNFKLGPMRTDVDPALDDMSRSWVGFSPDHSDQQTYDNNRGLWLLGRPAENQRYATFSFEGTVRIVVDLHGVETVPAKQAGSRRKRAIIGQVLQPGDPVYEALIGQSVDGHRNPVTYIPDADPRTCRCGCGANVAGGRAFLPGHDQRAVHDRITRQWGSTVGFIDWFDTTYPETA